MITHDEVFASLPLHVQEALRPGWVSDPNNRPGLSLKQATERGTVFMRAPDPLGRQVVEDSVTGEGFFLLDV